MTSTATPVDSSPPTAQRSAADVAGATAEGQAPSQSRSLLLRELELAFRLLGKRVYLPSLRTLRERHPGVDKASFALLALLADRAGQRPSDVATALDLDTSTISRHVTQLATAGLVDRSPDPDDRRAHRLSLSPTGRSAVAAVVEARADLLDAVLGAWPESDRADLLRLLRQLLDGMQDLPATASAPADSPAGSTSPAHVTSTVTETRP